MYLIGSKALELQHPLYKCSKHSDLDLVSEHRVPGFEHHSASLLNNLELCKYYSTGEKVIINDVEVELVSLKGLAIIKRSHLWRTYKFQKHMNEYNFFLKKFMYNLDETDNQFLSERIKLTQQEYKDFHPSLNKTVEEFFDDVVEKKYEHDYLHILYAYQEAPIYTMMQEDARYAKCSKTLWDGLHYQAKLQAVAEETYVIATERYLIPNQYDYDYFVAYQNALNRICTNLTSGWFRDFAIDNYELVLGMYSKLRILQVKQILGE